MVSHISLGFLEDAVTKHKRKQIPEDENLRPCTCVGCEWLRLILEQNKNSLLWRCLKRKKNKTKMEALNVPVSENILERQSTLPRIDLRVGFNLFCMNVRTTCLPNCSQSGGRHT